MVSIGRRTLVQRIPRGLHRLAVLAGLIAAFAVSPNTSSHAAEPSPAVLSVSATGSVVARPDIAVIDVGVVAEAKTSSEALGSANRAAEALLAEITAAGIAKADVASSDFSLSPQWAQKKRDGRDVNEIVGYSVTNRFTIRVRRLEALGPLLERVVAKGGNTVSGLSFEVADAEAKREEARVAAVEAATRRAAILAGAAHQRIVRVLTLSEGSSEPSRPVFAKRAMALDAAAVPVEAGTRAITAEVSMTFEIAPKPTE